MCSIVWFSIAESAGLKIIMRHNKFSLWIVLLGMLWMSCLRADPLQAWFVQDMAGKTHQLSDYKGQWLVVNYWAPWCPPCLEEFPSLIQLQKDMPNIAVVAVSFDEDPSAYRQYLSDNHITGITTILDTSQSSNHAFDTTRPPETYIIDSRGIIRRKFIGPQNWTNSEILNYLKNL